MKKPWYSVMEGKITFFSCSNEGKNKNSFRPQFYVGLLAQGEKRYALVVARMQKTLLMLLSLCRAAVR